MNLLCVWNSSLQHYRPPSSPRAKGQASERGAAGGAGATASQWWDMKMGGDFDHQQMGI